MFNSSKFRITSNYGVYGYSLLVGAVVGLTALIFSYLLHSGERLIRSLHNRDYGQLLSIEEKISFMTQDLQISLLIVILPAIGGLLVGLMTHYLCGDVAGAGLNNMIDAFHKKEGNFNTKVPFYKGVATIISIASGGSGGKEGPMAQIGGGIGVYISKLIGAGARARRTLLLAGSAAGLGALFKAPLGGTLTTVEMMYKEDIESDALIPCFISSVTAYLVYTLYAGRDAYMNISDVSFNNVNELIFYLLLGLACFLFGVLFIKGTKDTAKLVQKIKIHPVLKPMIGGLIVGLISMMFFEISGTGEPFLQQFFDGNSPNYFRKGALYTGITFLAIALLKILATTITIGSGGSAGIFGPSLFIGGMLGAAIGTFASYFWPQIPISIPAFAVIGMGAFYAGIANAPFAGIVMVVEMTGSYVLLVPLIIVSIFTFILSRRISYFENQMDNRFKSPAHHWDMKFDVIETIPVSSKLKDLRNRSVVKDMVDIDELRKRAIKLHASDFVVADKDDNYLGILSLRKIDFDVVSDSSDNSIRDFIDRSIPSVDQNDNLGHALSIIKENDVDKVAVTANGKILGYMDSRDIFKAYSLAVGKRNAP